MQSEIEIQEAEITDPVLDQDAPETDDADEDKDEEDEL
jgi:hypothetical protein